MSTTIPAFFFSPAITILGFGAFIKTAESFTPCGVTERSKESATICADIFEVFAANSGSCLNLLHLP